MKSKMCAYYRRNDKKKMLRKTSRLIRKKTNSYLKNTVMVFLLTIISMIYGIGFFGKNLQENRKNFINNDMVHFINIYGKFYENRFYGLNNKDNEVIQNLEKLENIEMISMYRFIGAVNNERCEPVGIVAIDPKYSQFVSKIDMLDNVFYSRDILLREELSISVPNIVVDEDGNRTSGYCVDITYPLLDCLKTDIESPLLHMYDNRDSLDEVFVTYNTLMNILKEAGMLDQNITDISDASEKEESMLNLSNIFINVNDVYEIDHCAKLLLDEDYAMDYTFDSFESMSESLRKSAIFFFLLLLIMILTSACNVFISFKEFLRMQQKDIGILKYMGYSDTDIYFMYRRTIDLFFVITVVLLSIVSFFIVKMMEIENIFAIIVGMISVICMLLLTLRIIIINVVLKKITKKQTLDLIKNSKEFE